MTNVFNLDGSPYNAPEQPPVECRLDNEIAEILAYALSIIDELDFMVITYRFKDGTEDCLSSAMLTDTLVSLAAYTYNYAQNVKFNVTMENIADLYEDEDEVGD